MLRPPRLLHVFLVALVLVPTGACVPALEADEQGASIRALYRKALACAAQGRPEESLKILNGFESAETMDRSLERVRSEQVRVVEELAAFEPSALLPVIGLHERAYLAYLSSGDEQAGYHSRSLMFLTAERYGERITSREDRVTAGEIFASLGGYFQATSKGSSGTELYLESLRFDHANEAALLGVAVAHEQHGRFERALAYLRRLPRTSQEGQLRLGVNLARSGEHERAITALRGILGLDLADWVRAIAYQQLARVLLDLGRDIEAMDVLSEATDRYPQDLSSSALRGYLEEQRGAIGPHEMLGALEQSARAEGRAPRYRYSRDPVEPLQASRERLGRLADGRLPTLAAALVQLKRDEFEECPLLEMATTSLSVHWTVTERPGEPVRVDISHPTPESVLFDEVEVVAKVASSESILRVDFLLDGLLMATDNEPPFRAVIEVGPENVDREIRVVAHTRSGRRGEATVETRAVPIDLELELPLQQLYVTVESEGALDRELSKEDFRVFDDGLLQQVVTFEMSEVPMTVVLLVDASESMGGERLEAALEAAREFQRQLGSLDEAMVIAFSDRTLAVSRFGQGGTDPTNIATPEGEGGTALNDHLYAALRLLDPRQGRPVALLLSDGADTLSLLRMQEVLWKVRRSDALLYRLRPADGIEGQMAFANSWRGFHENLEESASLSEAIRETGGRTRSVPPNQLTTAIRELIEELRRQVVLGYYPSNLRRDGSWHPLQVEVDVAGVTVRTRSGYIDD